MFFKRLLTISNDGRLCAAVGSVTLFTGILLNRKADERLEEAKRLASIQNQKSAELIKQADASAARSSESIAEAESVMNPRDLQIRFNQLQKERIRLEEESASLFMRRPG